MAKVCVDATGGDAGAAPVLEGVELALAERPSLSILLAGPSEITETFANTHERTEPLVTTQTIAMDEHPATAVRTKKDSEIVAGCKAVAHKRADAFFSAGSTGAVLAAATLYIKRIPGVTRPAIAAVLPSPTGAKSVLLDLGANADVRPEVLVQFAKMGSVYAKLLGFSDAPSVALLSNGEEDTKGSELALSYHAALDEAFKKGEILFSGNCEGSDLLTGEKNVIVCDGFSGNIAVKSVEGAARFIAGMLKNAAQESMTAAFGALLLKKTMQTVVDAISGNEHGGAILLGIQAPVFIGHGKSSAYAVKQGILAAEKTAQDQLVARIAQNL